MNIDERLLAASRDDKKRQEEASISDQLRQERMSAEDRERQGGGESQLSLRQRVQSARQAMDLKQRAKDKIAEKVAAPAKVGTTNALRWAWMTLIPSFGLSLIYINIHVFLRFVVGEKLFCKLGEEWIPKQVSVVGGDAGKTLGRSVGMMEVMGLLILDLSVLFVIFGFLALIVMIVDFIQASWYEKAISFLGGLTKLGWGGIKALFSLFAPYVGGAE